MDDLYCTLSSKMTGLLSSHINININFNHKIKEIQTLIVDDQFEEQTMIKLKRQLYDLHSLMDLKLQCTEEMNSACTLQSKAFLEIKTHLLDMDNNLDSLPNVYTDMQALHSESNQSLPNSTELIHSRLKITEVKDSIMIGQIENTKKKILMQSHSNDGGPLLRKKLNFNLKQTKHKSNKFIPFKKQNMFKNVEDSNFLKPNGLHVISNDSKYLNFSNKRKRLSFSNSLIYSRRTRNQPKKSNLWDHEDTRVYCICNKPSYGDMIACDSEKCKIEWFHYKCVEITTSPKGDWFCPMCKVA